MEKEKVNESQKGLEVSIFLAFGVVSTLGQAQYWHSKTGWDSDNKKRSCERLERITLAKRFALRSCLSFCQVKSHENFTFFQGTCPNCLCFSRDLTQF